MNLRKSNKKTKVRSRMLIAFIAVLFLSYFLTASIFNVAIRRNIRDGGYYYVAEQVAAERSGMILIPLVAIMFAASAIVSYFLANSITKPIERLGTFASGIGKGNFLTNDFEFRDAELDALNAALNKSVRQLGVYDETQKTFFQNASHELRTPLMSIKVYAEGIVYGIMDAKKAGETILEEADRLSELVTDLLYIAKIDNITTAYKTEAVDLSETIRNCVTRQQNLAEKKDLSFVFDFDEDGITYTGVADLLARAVDNLLSNAIRYAKSEIIISCRKYNGKVEIKFMDDGNGIEPDVLPHIFERFYKGKGGNTGIGLSIVKSIADQHGGHITAENRPSGGAIFTVNL
ncbi:MAG: HAMP domain-containing histidine kinase [Defluviitaleaceae bacterium]|nr:HAMP domain-containing histidine kinase [Defluviitaleaceae bacterium]